MASLPQECIEEYFFMHVEWLLLWNFFAVMGFMIAVWVLSVVLKNASIADTFWGLGFVLVAWITFAGGDGYLWRRLLITLMVTAWGLRLALHIGTRSWGKGEDSRYKAWRQQYGERFWWVSLFTVFLLQGLLLWVISLVAQVGQWSPKPDRLLWIDGLGFLVWAVGFYFEAVGDRQLASFKADSANRGRVMNQGLWRYTRHPNYFGECLMWWGIFLITLSTPGSFWTIVSPLTITYLLLKVSGVTLLERTIVETRPEYQAYQENTSAFIPWFPKRGKP
jgi:steroid 5-alpha reductase family enzyme